MGKSANGLGNQLQGINKSIEGFNKNYEQQAKKVENTTRNMTKNVQQMTNVPTNATVTNFNNIKNYTKQMESAEKQLRSKFSDGQGIFSSKQLKDAQGNLRGFVASLERADGVVDKVYYKWNNKKNTFQVVDRQTVNNIQKMTHTASQSLRSLQADIDKLGRSDGKTAIQKDWKALNDEVRRTGSLTKDAVRTLQDRIKQESVLQGKIKQSNTHLSQQNRLIRDIKNSSRTAQNIDDRKHYMPLIKDARNSSKSSDPSAELARVRLEMDKLNDRYKRQAQDEKKLQQITKQRLSLVRELHRVEATMPTTGRGLVQREAIAQARDLANSTMRTRDLTKATKQLTEAQKMLGNVRNSKWLDSNQAQARKHLADLKSLEQSLKHHGVNMKKFYADINRLEQKEGGKPRRFINVADAKSELDKYSRMLRTKKVEISNIKREIATGVDISRNFGGTKKIEQDLGFLFGNEAINKSQMNGIQNYIGRIENAKVATLSFKKDAVDPTGKRMRVMEATFESTGKSARKVTYGLVQGTNQMRRISDEMVFNANRNLGVWQQMSIAMKRVPVWMGAMTAFYGSIERVRSMIREIIAVDTLMTTINRVSGSHINVNTLLKGSVQLSKELGNNLHNILESVGTFARTFGDFNERQLLNITRTVTLMSNVSELTTKEATESLVGVMNAFNIEASNTIRIVDALNEVDNNYAISTKQLAEGMLKSSATAKTFGVTLEENIGNITAIGAVTMESGKIIGNSLKTIYSRITTLPKVEEVLNDVGVAVKGIGVNGEEYVRPVNDILKDLAGSWHGLTDAKQQNIAVEVAGRFQLTRFLALMNNYQVALDSTETAVHSHGSAMRENAKYMQSFEARLNQVKNSFTAMSLSFGDALLRGSMLGVISLMKTMANTMANLADRFGILPVLLAALYLPLKMMGAFTGLHTLISKSITTINAFRIQHKLATIDGIRGTQALSLAWKNVDIGIKKATFGTKTFGMMFKSVAISTGIGVALVGIGVAIERLVSRMQKKKQIAEELENTNKQLVDSYNSLGKTDGITKLINQYEYLQDKKDKGTLNNQELEEYNRLTTQLANSMPTFVDRIDAQGNAHLKTAKQMKEQLKVTEELAEANRNLTLAKFAEDIKTGAEEFQRLQSELEEMERNIAGWKNSHGQYVIQGHWEPTKELIDNSVRIQEEEIKKILKQAELNELIQSQVGIIQRVSLVWLEQEGIIGNVGDAQQKAIENFIAYNSEILYGSKNSVEMQEKLFELGRQTGEVFHNIHKNFTKDIEDPMKLREIEDNLNNITKSIPEGMFVLDENGSIEKTTQDLGRLLTISMDIGEDTSYESLKQQLINAGIEADKARDFIGNLGVTTKNASLQAKAMEEGYEEANHQLERMIENIIEMLDLTKEVFGYNNQDLSAMESYLQYMELMVKIHGEGIKSTDAYIERQQDLAEFLGVTVEELEKNHKHYKEIIEGLKNLDLATYDSTKSWNAWIDSQENLTKAQKDAFKNMEYGKDIITGLIDESKILTDANDGLVESFEEVEEKAVTTEEKMEELQKAFGNMKESMDATDKSIWMETIRTQLEGLEDGFSLVDDGNGKLKIALASGEGSEYIDLIHSQLDELGYEIELVRDGTGQLQVIFNNGEESKTLNNYTEGAENLKVRIDESAESLVKVNDLGISPEINLEDFDSLAKEIQDVSTSIEDLNESFGRIRDNIKALTDVEQALQKLKDLAGNIKDAMHSLFSDSKGDLENMRSDAENAMKAVDGLRDSIEKIKNIASNLDTKGFKDVEKAVDNVNGSVDALEAMIYRLAIEFENVANKIKPSTENISSSVEDNVDAISDLEESFTNLKREVESSFDSMRSKVSSNTATMIDTHDSQKTAIERLAISARDARRDIEFLNSIMPSATNNLNNYIARARSTSSVSSPFGFGSFGTRSYQVSSDSLSSAIGSVTALSGGGEGSSSGEGGGTSGTIVTGSRNFIGGYDFQVLSGSSNRADLFKVNNNERQLTVMSGTLRELETRMQRINKNSLSYRNNLQKAIQYQNTILSLTQRELRATENRNKQVERRLKQLSNTSKHTEKQREEYNRLQQEFESNLSKIANLRVEVQSVTNDIRQKSSEIFSDFIDEIVGKYDRAILRIRDRIDTLDFNLQVLELTNPDDLKSQLKFLEQKTKRHQEEQASLANMEKELQKQYNNAVKKYGSNSQQARKVKEELRSVTDAWRSATISVLRTERQIKDVREKVAEDGIRQLRDYYSRMKDMSIRAIEKEQKHLRNAHDERMKMFDEQAKQVNSLYNEKLKQLDKERAQEEFQARLDEENARKADILRRIALASRDTSLEGRRRLSELQKDLTESEKTISNLIRTNQETLLREQLEEQRQAQLKAIESAKEIEQEKHDKTIDLLDKEREELEKFYNDILDNERYWTEMRDEFVKGNFANLTNELKKMSEELEKMSSGNFDNLTKSFHTFSDEVKRAVAEINRLTIDNLILNSDGTIMAVRQVSQAKTNTNTRNNNSSTTSGRKVSTPAKTTSTSKNNSSSSSSSSRNSKNSVSNLPLRKGNFATPRGGWDKNSVVDYIKSRGYHADFSDRDKLFKHLKGSGNYRGTAAQNDWLLRQLKIVGLRSGGYTGNQQGLAYLHEEEQVFNKKDTKNLLDASKILRTMSNILPKLAKPNMKDKLGIGENSSVSYGDINVVVQNGDKKKSTEIAHEILKGLKKRGG